MEWLLQGIHLQHWKKKHEEAKLACIRLEDEKIFYQNSPESKNKKNLYLDGIMGLVVGDALGVPVEFSSREERKQGGGYVIESIEATLWCLLNTSSYDECVLAAVNLGHDTDTTVAIAGGLAGVYYGYDAIPEKWKTDIIRRSWIEEMCNRM